jgi:hypothetical protein
MFFDSRFCHFAILQFSFAPAKAAYAVIGVFSFYPALRVTLNSPSHHLTMSPLANEARAA